ncbi:competence/damage-inducible protein A [Halorientalis salina]|uniref:competence/damage-inducible protein A n=1 Tax=Halorientalis salina TaxID=2932266 RepID=UPI0010AD8033|nr:molybdopterin-binding protein [Halorientalis salina]
MQVALLTVGDELLAGDTVNTNATWLADRLSERGVSVQRVLVVPDDREDIAENVRTYSEAYDAVVVTGGLGGTPDDVTMAAVADAFDRELAVDDLAFAEVEETLAAIAESYPDLDIDAETEATIPAGSRPLLNRGGLSPGCVVENVYVLPGIPDEMKTMFEAVEEEFEGDAVSEFLYTERPEGNLVDVLTEAGKEFDVSVGCYPDRSAGHNRLKVTGDDPEEVEAAIEWLIDETGASEEPLD